MKAVIEFFKQLFEEPSEQSKIEVFLKDKGITTHEELEYWLGVYEYKFRMYSLYASNGDYHRAQWELDN